MSTLGNLNHQARTGGNLPERVERKCIRIMISVLLQIRVFYSATSPQGIDCANALLNECLIRRIRKDTKGRAAKSDVLPEDKHSAHP